MVAGGNEHRHAVEPFELDTNEVAGVRRRHLVFIEIASAEERVSINLQRQIDNRDQHVTECLATPPRDRRARLPKLGVRWRSAK